MAHEQFILGYIAGEGSFNAKLQRDKNKSGGYNIVPCFEIHVRKNQRKTAELIRDEMPFDIKLYEKEKTLTLYYGGYTKMNEFFEWVEGHSNEAFRESGKYRSMLKLRGIVEMMHEDKHRFPEGVIEIVEVRDSMNGNAHPSKVCAEDVRKELRS